MEGCTPSPKYHGRTRDKEREEELEPVPQVADISLDFLYPVRGFSDKRISSRFGRRKHPRMKTVEFHKGIDIKAGFGEDVLASESGTVKFAGRQSGYGKVIIIDHGDRVCTVYAHLSEILVEMNQIVERGMVIGLVGRSGRAIGVHLHFEVRIRSKAVDPLAYL